MSILADALTRFYSILVRLKDKAHATGVTLKMKFLFHIGSIKSRQESEKQAPKVGFYSILVRLKGHQKRCLSWWYCYVSIPYWFD